MYDYNDTFSMVGDFQIEELLPGYTLYFTCVPGGKLVSFDSNRNFEMRAAYSGYLTVLDTVKGDISIPFSGERTVIVKDLYATCEHDGKVVVHLWLQYQEGELTCPYEGMDLCSGFKDVGHEPILEPEFDFKKNEGYFVTLESGVYTGQVGTHYCEYYFTLWPAGEPLY